MRPSYCFCNRASCTTINEKNGLHISPFAITISSRKGKLTLYKMLRAIYRSRFLIRNVFSWNLFIAIPLFHLSRSCRKEHNCTNILLLNKLYEKPATQMYRVSIESTDLKPITLDRLLICVTLGFVLSFTTWKVIRTFVVAKDSTVQHSLIFAYIRRKNIPRATLQR